MVWVYLTAGLFEQWGKNNILGFTQVKEGDLK